MDFQFSFDNAKSFRRSPWLYAILGFLFVGIAALFVWLVASQWFSRPQGPAPFNPIANETPEDKSDRLVIMNVLNRFHIEEGKVPRDASDEERTALRKEHLDDAIARLKVVETSGAHIQSAQNDLILMFNRWNAMLDFNENTSGLRADFVELGKKYPWMNTLIWLILLNRL